MTPKNWTLNSYTDDTWTDLVAEPATVAAVIVANSGEEEAEVKIRLEDAGSSLATVLPPSVVAANESYTLDVRSLNLTGTQKLQIQCDVAGCEFVASGVVA